METKRKSERDYENYKSKSIKTERDERTYSRDQDEHNRRQRARSRSRSRERDRNLDSFKDRRKHREKKQQQEGEEDTKHYEYGKKVKEEKKDDDEAPIEKEKPSLALSGNLLKDTNTFNGVVVNYVEPSEARKPRKRWRLYVFKGEQELPFYQIHRQSAYLFGRDRKVADIPVDHPSCSKQHAVFQYRLVEYKRTDGSSGRVVKPYIIDLGSTNGTYINNSRIEAQRYYEVKEKDVIKFGFSTRDFVLLHEESKNDLEDDLSYESDQSDKSNK